MHIWGPKSVCPTKKETEEMSHGKTTKNQLHFCANFFSNLTQPGRFDVYDKAAAKEEGGACVGAERAAQKDHRDHKHQTLWYDEKSGL